MPGEVSYRCTECGNQWKGSLDCPECGWSDGASHRTLMARAALSPTEGLQLGARMRQARRDGRRGAQKQKDQLKRDAGWKMMWVSPDEVEIIEKHRHLHRLVGAEVYRTTSGRHLKANGRSERWPMLIPITWIDPETGEELPMERFSGFYHGTEKKDARDFAKRCRKTADFQFVRVLPDRAGFRVYGLPVTPNG